MILAELLYTIIFWGCSFMGIEKFNNDFAYIFGISPDTFLGKVQVKYSVGVLSGFL